MSAECSIKVQMFSGARGVSIRNSEINNVAGDMIINVHGQPDLEPVQVHCPATQSLSLTADFECQSSLRDCLIGAISVSPFNCSIHKHNETHLYIGIQSGDSE